MKYFLAAVLHCMCAAIFAQAENEKKFSTAELLADYDTLYSWLKAVHPKLYGNVDSNTTEKLWMEQRHHFSGPMTKREFSKAVAPLVHQYNDAHTYVEVDFNDPAFQRFKKEGNRLFPVPIRILHDSVLVLADSLLKVEPGSVIVNINGKSIAEILATVTVLLSGDSKENLEANISRLFPYLYWLAYQTSGPYKVHYITPQGVRKEIKLDGLLVDDYFKRIFPTPLWKMKLHPQEKLAVIECTGYNGNIQRIQQKLDSFFTIIRQQGVRHVALDLRRNGGGNSYIGDIFLSYVTSKPFSAVRSKSYRNSWAIKNFPETDFRKKDLEAFIKTAREENGFYTTSYTNAAVGTVTKPAMFFDGQFYLLTSHRTYSSAHITALQVKCSELGKIIGQPTGEMVDLTGEIKVFVLPNTKLAVWIPLAMYKAACEMNQKVGVQPDYYVQPTLQDIMQDRDAEVTFLKSLIRRSK